MSKKEVKEYNRFISQLLPRIGSFGSVNDKEAGRYNYIAYMLNRTAQMFEWSGLPETIPERMLELQLQVNGFSCITEVENEGLYAFFGGLGGVPDAYYMPTECIVNNPALNFNKTLKIGEDCIIIRNDNMYSGLMPLCGKYAELLVENDITFRVMSINSRLSNVISAGSDRTKEAAKEFMKDIEAGKLASIGEADFLEGVRVQPASVAATNRVIDLIEYNQYLKASWFNDLGVQANFNMKREALTPDEVQLNIKALMPLVENMLFCRQEAAEKINAKYGTDISVDFRGVWKDTQEEVENVDQLTEQPETDPQEAAEEKEQEDEISA